MANWLNQLKKAMQDPRAATYVEKRNAEEPEFRKQLGTALHQGYLVTGVIVKFDERTGHPISISKVQYIDRRDKKLCNQHVRRPKIEWTTEVRMSRPQTQMVQSLILGDWSVWCFIRKTDTDARAVLLKLGIQWAVVYEDGTEFRGTTPVLLEHWPQVLRPSKAFKEQQKVLEQERQMDSNELGGVVVNRYKAKSAAKLLDFDRATDRNIQLCAKFAGIDECGKTAMCAIESERLTEGGRLYLIRKLKALGYKQIDMTDKDWIKPVK